MKKNEQSTSTMTDSLANSFVDKDSYFKAMEKKYFIPLLIGEDRLKKMMNSLFKTQTKIQKALNKRQV
jgi:hypothetical protein